MIAPRKSFPLFPFGETLATPAALEALTACGHVPADFIGRHVRGDWGEVDAEDRPANDEAVHSGERILSVYRTRNGVKIWIITEADRSTTTIILPEEY